MSNEINNLCVDGERLWTRLMEMAQIGATAKGGVCRVTLTDEDKAGRDLFVQWCEAAGLTISVDQMGNIFARRAGTNNEAPPVMAGSHLDSQPTGGKFDGVYGVLAALEVVETLNDHNLTTDIPIEIVSWTNEEGARFNPAMISSGVFGGAFDLEYGLSRTDKEGKTIGEELARIGYAGEMPVGGRTFTAAFELHIEQGPILEIEQKSVGIVTGVQGIRWYHIIIEGKEAHSGPTPMEYRRDPGMALWRILRDLYEMAGKYAPHGRATVGDFMPEPGVINTIPGRLTITVDLRHPDPDTMDAMDTDLRELVAQTRAETGLKAEVDEMWYSPPVAFAPECIAAVKKGTEISGVSAMEIVSGAGHDAVYVARVAPTSMIFVPCEDGLSHNELEKAEKEDIIAGANVLLHAVLDRAS